MRGLRQTATFTDLAAQNMRLLQPIWRFLNAARMKILVKRADIQRAALTNHGKAGFCHKAGCALKTYHGLAIVGNPHLGATM